MSALEDSTARHESTVPKPYRDSRGLWTFGTGRCLETNPLTGSEWKRLLDAGAITVSIAPNGSAMLLADDLVGAAAQCAKFFKFWPELNQVRRDVLTEMCFQLGIQGLLGFHQMIGFIDAGDFGLAADAGLDSDWQRQTPARATELMQKLRSGL